MSEITRVLASDEFQGRSMGGPGEEKTVAYLTEQFKAAGLEPGGENGGWTQTVPMIRTKLQAPVRFSVSREPDSPLRFPDDIYLSTVRDTDRAKIAGAPMVFVGYGVTAPERGWDDFKGVDLKGKVAVFLVNDPDFEARRRRAGRRQVQRQDDDLLRALDLQVRGGRAARRDGGADRPRHARRRLRLERRPERRRARTSTSSWRPNAHQPVLLQGWIQGPICAGDVQAARVTILRSCDGRRGPQRSSR